MSYLMESKVKGIKVTKTDLNTNTLPFRDGEFDVASAFDVIKHLWNTDNMISEAHRVLKRNGLFILTTPNLASWVNRLLLLLGYLPAYYECSLKHDLEKRPLRSSFGLYGHMRLYTFKILEKHLKAYGFRVIYSTSHPTGYVTAKFVIRMLNSLFGSERH